MTEPTTAVDPDTVPYGEPWSAELLSGYRCTAIKRMTPGVDDAHEWVVVARDGRSHIGEPPPGLRLIARLT